MLKFKNAKKRGRWKLKTGSRRRRIWIRSKKPGKWMIRFTFGSGKPNKMKKMRKMDRLRQMKRMSKMKKMRKMYKLARLPKLKMRH